MKLHALTKAVTLATLLSAASFSAVAADIPLSAVVEADQINATVVSVDAAKHQVVLKGPDGREVHFQLTDKAKNLGNLKAGDQVDIKVVRSVAAYLDTNVDKGLPGTTEGVGEARNAPGSAPGGEAYRQVQVQLQITDIDVKKNQVTLKNPEGVSKTITVEKPEIQAKLKDLKVGQSVRVTYTDFLQVTSKSGS
jgi:Cu/Ag efflux protein CusF